MKRAFDIVVAVVGLVLVSPFLAASALAVRVTSGSPVLYRQERVGRYFQSFEIVKLRTMTTHPGPVVTVGADPRITPVGRWLRRTKVDELPQLWNVVRGDMSLVGPRPEVPIHVEQFRADYEVVLTVRPGITDDASLRYRREAQVLAASADPERAYVEEILPDKLRVARRYVAERSFTGDLRILARTLMPARTPRGPDRHP
jgi:lipopolysaccharide/colanic/teichoic acid biosynthesis glycosyltransferase